MTSTNALSQSTSNINKNAQSIQGDKIEKKKVSKEEIISFFIRFMYAHFPSNDPSKARQSDDDEVWITTNISSDWD